MTYSKGKHLLQIVSVLSSEQMTNNKDIFRRVVLRIKKQHVCQALGFGVVFGGNRRGQDRLGWRQSRASHRWMNIRSTYVRTPITQTSKPHPDWASCLVWLEWDLKICILNKLFYGFKAGDLEITVRNLSWRRIREKKWLHRDLSSP